MNENEDDQPILEVREVRHQISARFNHDPEKLVAYYMKLQDKYKERLLDTSQENEQHAA